MNRLPAPVFFSSSSPIARSGFIRTGSTASLPNLISFVSSAVCSWTLGSKAKRADEQQVALAALDRFQRGLLDVGVADACRTPGRRRRGRAAPASVSPSAWMYSPGKGSSRAKVMRCALVRPLHAGLAEVVEDHLAEVRGRGGRGRGPSVASAVVAAGRLRCGDRLSTVNGPVTGRCSCPRRAGRTASRSRRAWRSPRRSARGSSPP